ncbi:hypothetical protein P1X14_05215 [Sphingomonas sp. AOB5]|uniref:hypothetical protein n=1 Tax=Sphingomonas sp. AOB5 TaxID=3034017 RepID=UPI0023F9ABDA|nr:hypothetical protein [Sphingomonas sp. AOB5]MDF7774638.1 hypothetical protein [Sphingomonas sp. AOB5]
MRKSVLGLALGSVIAGPASAQAVQQAGRFAISCSGTNTATVQRPGSPAQVTSSRASGVLYVIDEGAKTVERMGLDGVKFEDVCRIDAGCTRDFSATRITVSGEITRTGTGEQATTWRRVSLFDWDRGTGKLDTKFDMIGTTTMTALFHGTLTCKPAKIPASYVPKA